MVIAVMVVLRQFGKLSKAKLRCFRLGIKNWSLQGTRLNHQNAAINTKPFSPYPSFHETIKIPGDKTMSPEKNLDVHPVWLRHHCQCDKCFNSKTYQRVIIPSQLATSSEIKDLRIESDTLKITWIDEHLSTYKIQWLEQNSPKKSKPLGTQQNHLEICEVYNYEKYPETPPDDPLSIAVNYENVMQSSDGVAELLNNIVRFGYGLVKNVPPDFDSTKKVLLRISHPQNTIFGDFSEWTSDLAHADTAYTADFVHLHSDTSYFSEPMGLQMFHCLKHEGSGGINLIQDSFKIAKKMHSNFPDLHAALTEVLIPCQYLDPGKHHFLSLGTTFTHNRLTGAIERVRYNPHDMATLNTIAVDQVGTFYNSLVKFSHEVENNPTQLKLLPGLMIFLDNWRVFHGRTEFTGFRHMAGAYIGRSDWLSKARVLGVIT